MPVIALILYVAFLVLTMGVRMAIQFHRTRSTGFNSFRGKPGSLEWFAGIFFVGGALAVPLAPIFDLLGIVEPIAALDTVALNFLGVVLAVAGLVLVFAAQMAMGDSWRIGVEQEERTELVTTGPFGVVRNPIFGASIPLVIGFCLMVPSLLSLAALVVIAISLELLVRAVEEPYLLRTHGSAYSDYAARVGRFVPGVGLIAVRAPES